MPRFRTYSTEAIVVRQTSLGETDRVLTLFTPQLGKLGAVAKGVRRPGSRMGGHLELLNLVRVSLAQGRTLDVITDAHAVQIFSGLRGQLHSISRAMYAAELVDRFSIDRSPNLPVYRLLLEALTLLDAGLEAPVLLRHFELMLLEHSGYRPELFWCVECRAELQPSGHAFSNTLGGVLCPDCRTGAGDPLTQVSLEGMKVLRYLQRAPELGTSARLRAPAGVAVELERLCHLYVRHILDRELKSAAFVNTVTGLRPQPARDRGA